MSGPITQLQVTYGGAMGATKFHRIVNAAHEGGDVNIGGSTSVFVWYKRNDGTPILDIAVLYDAETPAEGFELVSKSLARGPTVAGKVFLAVRTGQPTAELLPISDILLLEGNAPAPTDDGWHKIDRNINRAGHELFLWVRRSQPSEVPDAWTPSMLVAGDWFDCLDTVNKWCVAQVLEVLPDSRIRIQYKGWGSKWNEVLPLDSPRIAELGSHGGTSGPKLRKPGNPLDLSIEELDRYSDMVTSAATGALDADVYEQFLKQQLPEFMELNLQSEHTGTASKADVQLFIQKTLRFIVGILKGTEPAPAPAILVLKQILLLVPTATWFFEHAGMCAEDSAIATQVRGDWGRVPPSGASAFLVADINVLGDAGFFDAVMQRVQATDPAIPLPEIQALLACVHMLRHCYNPTFGKPYAAALKPAVFNRLRNLSDSELTDVDQTIIDEIITLVEGICIDVLKVDDQDAELELMRFHLARRLIICPYIIKRIRGADELQGLTRGSDIEEAITVPAASRRMGRWQGVVAPPPPPRVLAMGAEALANLIVEHRVLEAMLGGEVDGVRRDLHVELIKRMGPVVRFLARAHLLSNDMISMIWACGETTNDAMTRAVYDVIGKLGGCLDVEQLDFVYSKLQSIPRAAYTDVVLKLVQDFTERAVSVAAQAGADRAYGLDLIWSCIQDDAALPNNLNALCEKMLAELLKGPSARPQAVAFMHKCMANLKAGTSVPQSLRLVQWVVGALPLVVIAPNTINPALDMTRSTALETLDEAANVVPSLVADIQRYAAAVKSAVAGGAVCNPTATLCGRYTHAQQVSERLEFLKFFLSSTSRMLDFEDVRTIWQTLAVQPLHAEDINTVLVWLLQSVFPDNDTQPSILDEDTVENTFVHLFCQPDVLMTPFLSSDAMHCFTMFFESANIRGGYLRATVDGIESLGFNFIGLPKLWQLVLGPSVAASADAIMFLVEKHTTVAPGLDVHRAWSAFITDIMARLRQTLDDAPAGDAAAGFAAGQYLAVLDAFLKAFLPKSNARRVMKLLNDDDMEESLFRLTCWLFISHENRPTSQESMQVVVERTTTLGSLRRSVSLRMHWPASQIRFSAIMGDKQYPSSVFDSTPISVLEPSLRLRVTLLAVPDPSDPANAAASRQSSGALDYVRALIANNDAYVELLFRTLSVANPASAAAAWRLLCYLPVNKSIQTGLTTFGGTEGDEPVAWDALLSGASLPRLLYSLQIVDAFVCPVSTTTAADPAVQEWTARFIASGGVAHLVSILLHTEAQVLLADALHTACMALLVKLIGRCMSGRELPNVNLEELVNRLLVLVVKATEIADATAADASQAVVTPAAQAAAVSDSPNPGYRYTAIDSDDDSEDDYDIYRLNMNRSGTPPPPRGGTNGAAPPPPPPPVSNEAEVVRCAIDLLVSTLKGHSELLPHLYNFPNVSQAFLYGVLHSSEVAVRTQVAKGIESLCFSIRDPVSVPKEDGSVTLVHPPLIFFAPLLLAEAVKLPQYERTCSEYVTLVSQLLTQGNAFAAVREHVDVQPVAEELMELIRSRPIVELAPSDEDSVLQGYASLLAGLIAGESHLQPGGARLRTVCAQMVHWAFHALFDLPTAETHVAGGPPQCKNGTTRAVVFNLLVHLCEDCIENTITAMQLLQPHHLQKLVAAKQARRTMWDLVSGVSDTKSRTGYVGLNNLGMICYMNATMQQLFMVPHFRREVLRFETDDDDQSSTTKDTDNVMHQMQVMFAHLQESEKQSFDPKPFTHAVKDMGEPTDVMVQKDASEFLANLFQQIDSCVQGTESEGILRRCFGGTLSAELLADGQYSEREETFFVLSVSVKNLRTLEDSLLEFIAGEKVEYRWDTPDGAKQLETTKRASIKQLPPTLIVHLKRFEFDFDMLQQVKVNSRFEFPRRLNLKPYTKEGREDKASSVAPTPAPITRSSSGGSAGGGGEDDTPVGAKEDEGVSADLPDDFYEYELMGIVVHTGTADMGHYYSFIRERDDSYTGTGTDQRRWMQFNDSVVSSFSEREIERETFGGSSTNAFLLVYDRVYKPDAPTPVAEAAGSAGKTRDLIVRNRAPIAPHIFEAIWKENTEHWHKQHVYNTQYFEFMWRFATQLHAHGAFATMDETMQAQCMQFFSLFMFNTLSQASAAQAVPQWSELLSQMCSVSPAASAWLVSQLINRREFAVELLLEQTGAQMVAAISSILVSAYKALAASQVTMLTGPELPEPLVPSLPASFLATTKEALVAAYLALKQPPVSEDALALAFIDLLLSMLPLVPQYWVTADVYNSMLGALLANGDVERMLLLRRGALTKFTRLLLDQARAADELAALRAKTMGNTTVVRSLTAELSGVVSIIVRLALSALPPSGSSNAPTQQSPQVVLNEEEMRSLTSDQLFTSAFFHLSADPVHSKSFRDFVTHMCWESEVVSTQVANLVATSLVREDESKLKAIFKVVTTMCRIADSMQCKRTDIVMRAVLVAMESLQGYFVSTESSIAQMAPHYVAQNADLTAWCVTWLQTHQEAPSWFNTGLNAMKLYKQDSSVAVVPERSELLLPNLMAARLGHPVAQDGYDSEDDPTTLIGQRVKVRWNAGKWYSGVVEDFRESDRQHFVVYDDGDKRWHNMAIKEFVIIPVPTGAGLAGAGAEAVELTPMDDQGMLMPELLPSASMDSEGNAVPGAGNAWGNHDDDDDDYYNDGDEGDDDSVSSNGAVHG